MEFQQRRAILLNEMDQKAADSVDCRHCPGHCCTAMANSMQTTPLETQDVFEHLQQAGRWNDELKMKLQDTTKRFRLDVMVGNGRRSYLRRTYDCPFFAGSSLGCTIPREIKPYGCLGFNPAKSHEVSGESCSSDQNLLLKREELNTNEAYQNQELQNKYRLWWDKLPLPYALLEWEQAIKR